MLTTYSEVHIHTILSRMFLHFSQTGSDETGSDSLSDRHFDSSFLLCAFAAPAYRVFVSPFWGLSNLKTKLPGSSCQFRKLDLDLEVLRRMLMEEKGLSTTDLCDFNVMGKKKPDICWEKTASSVVVIYHML